MGKGEQQESDVAPSVVFHTPSGGDQHLIAELLTRNELQSIKCESFDELIQQAEAGTGSIIVAEEALYGDGVSRLGEILDDQPAWSELPLIVLRGGDGRADGNMQPLLRRGGVRWLNRPIAMQTLAVLVMTSVEARRRQVQVGELLKEQDRLNEKLKNRSDRLRQLTVELVEAEDRERRRIAELLHDDLQQMLVGASFRLEAAMKQIDPTSGLVGLLKKVRRLITDSQRRCRLLSHELFPTALSEGDLPAVLQWLAQHAEDTYGLTVELECESDLGEVSPTILRFVYRAVREILLNAVKHAHADSVHVTTKRRGNQLELVLSDQGVGFDPERFEDYGVDLGIGLLMIRERASLLGGEFLISSQAGAGSRFHFSVPAQT